MPIQATESSVAFFIPRTRYPLKTRKEATTILNWIVKGLIQWLYGLVWQIGEYIMNALMDVFNMDMTFFNPVRAYLRGENPDIKNGVRIRSLHLIEKKGTYGPYYIVDKYEIAA